MAGCKLTKNLGGKECKYSIAGARAIYLANFFTAVGGTTSQTNKIAYEFDAQGYITAINCCDACKATG